MKILIIVLMAAASAIAQDVPPQLPAQKSFKTDCSKVAMATSCKSYNEMVDAKDKDLMGYLSTENAFVCFRETEDVFSLISFVEPAQSFYKKDKKYPFLLTASGLLFYSRYAKGQNDDFRMFPGTWSGMARTETSMELADRPTFSTNDAVKPNQASVDQSEVGIIYTYQNLSRTTTTYSIQIRRSTLRFNETWTFPADDKKSADTRIEATGHCITFN